MQSPYTHALQSGLVIEEDMQSVPYSLGMIKLIDAGSHYRTSIILLQAVTDNSENALTSFHSISLFNIRLQLTTANRTSLPTIIQLNLLQFYATFPRYIIFITMPYLGMRVRLQQARDAFLSAQKDWNDAKDRLTSLQASLNEKQTLADDISSGRQLKSTPYKAKMLEVEIQGLNRSIAAAERGIIQHRGRMDAAEAIFNQLEGLKILDTMPGM
ncbi:unnamed protein product [Fusarium graminearum]|nr:unnamed protein product [Fusarium graminearum]